jgi:rhodanese-related sulfurtransferase
MSGIQCFRILASCYGCTSQYFRRAPKSLSWSLTLNQHEVVARQTVCYRTYSFRNTTVTVPSLLRSYATHVEATGTQLPQSPLKKMLPKDFYWYIRKSGEQPILLDIREKDAFNQFHIFGTFNFPASTTKLEDIHDMPKNRPIFILSAGREHVAQAVKFGLWLKQNGWNNVTAIDGGPEELRRAGFLYCKDIELQV